MRALRMCAVVCLILSLTLGTAGAWATAGVEDHYEPASFADAFTRVLSLPWLSALLFALGMVALLAELLLPGFGVWGVVSVVCLTLYFVGAFLQGSGEWWSVTLAVVGVGLLVVELFVPGFGLPGIAGGACLLAGLYFTSPSIEAFGITLAATVVLALLALPLLYHLVGKSRVMDKLTLHESLDAEKGFTQKRAQAEVGERGVAQTDLRPSGSIQMGDRRLDAVSDGEFIPKGSAVLVTRVSGMNVRVRRVDDDDV